MNKPVSKPLRPDPETRAGRIWAIADRITQAAGRKARRAEVIDAFVSEGGNANTASTQYSHWKADHHRQSGNPGHAAPSSSGRMTLHIGSVGRLLIPLELRSQMLIGEDGKVSARIEEGELRIISPKCALMRLQQKIRDLDRGEGSPVDELIAERRAEAQEE